MGDLGDRVMGDVRVGLGVGITCPVYHDGVVMVGVRVIETVGWSPINKYTEVLFSLYPVLVTVIVNQLPPGGR